jgi:hypothetical protein
MTTIEKSAVKEFVNNVMNNNWNWGLEEFARRCKLDPKDAHTEAQWQAFQNLHKALLHLDCDVLNVIGAKEAEVPTP